MSYLSAIVPEGISPYAHLQKLCQQLESRMEENKKKLEFIIKTIEKIKETSLVQIQSFIEETVVDIYQPKKVRVIKVSKSLPSKIRIIKKIQKEIDEGVLENISSALKICQTDHEKSFLDLFMYENHVHILRAQDTFIINLHQKVSEKNDSSCQTSRLLEKYRVKIKNQATVIVSREKTICILKKELQKKEQTIVTLNEKVKTLEESNKKLNDALQEKKKQHSSKLLELEANIEKTSNHYKEVIKTLEEKKNALLQDFKKHKLQEEKKIVPISEKEQFQRRLTRVESILKAWPESNQRDQERQDQEIYQLHQKINFLEYQLACEINYRPYYVQY